MDNSEKLQISTLNVNGWTNNNCLLRESIVKSLDQYIFCLIETHLLDNQQLQVENYVWHGYNMKGKHDKARKGLGGVGILVKNSLLKSFIIEVIDKSVQGILGLLFQRRNSSFCFIVFACYLPPEGSPWADPTIFFGHLISQIYLYSTTNTIIICGNARIGKNLDVALFDNTAKRKIIDSVKNSYGDNLIDFLKEVKFCVASGRVTPHLDNFTSTAKGTAVVDYILIPHDCLMYCKCSVTLISDIIDKYNLASLLSSSSKQPDHSVVSLEYQYAKCYLENDISQIMYVNSVNGYGNGLSDNPLINDQPVSKRKYIFGMYSNHL